MEKVIVELDVESLVEQLMEMGENEELSEEDGYELNNVVQGLQHVRRLVNQPGIDKLIKAFSKLANTVQNYT